MKVYLTCDSMIKKRPQTIRALNRSEKRKFEKQPVGPRDLGGPATAPAPEGGGLSSQHLPSVSSQCTALVAPVFLKCECVCGLCKNLDIYIGFRVTGRAQGSTG